MDLAPRAVDAARGSGGTGAGFVVGDVTDLEVTALGRFDFFLDVGCFQGLTREQRAAEGHVVKPQWYRLGRSAESS